MPRKPQPDPAALDRLRRARATEDAALEAVSSAQARVASATEKRRLALVAFDATVADAETELAQARAALADAAGLQRAAVILGLSTTELRKTTNSKGRTKDAANAGPAGTMAGSQLGSSFGGTR